MDGEAKTGDVIRLPAVLDMRHARELQKVLAVALDRRLASEDGEIVLDANAVARLSTGCIQVLAAFVTTMAGAGQSVRFYRPSAVMVAGFVDLGLGDMFEKTAAGSE